MKKVQRLVVLVLVLATLSVSFAEVTGHTKKSGNRTIPSLTIAQFLQEL
jgi:hypothetical protein